MLGDVDVATISKPMVVELRSNLLKLPANLYKKYPDKTIPEILGLNVAEPMSLKTVNKHVARLGAVLRYCVDEKIIGNNPATGLKITEKKKASEERSSYCKDDVKLIVKSLPTDSRKPEQYWIPMIGLYSGLIRLN